MSSRRIFYGWWIVLVAFVCHATITTSLALALKPYRESVAEVERAGA